MRFISSVFAGAAFVAAALAIEINSFPASVKAGDSAEIKYSGGNSGAATTLILRKGPSDDLANITTLTEAATGGSYTWDVPTMIPSGDDYALTIIQGGESNFWGPFKITGGVAASSSASSASSASSSASSAASSSASMSMTMTSTGTAASTTPSSSANGTVSSATLSTTARPSGSGTPTGSGGVPQGTGAASALGSSPLALLFGAVAAVAYLN